MIWDIVLSWLGVWLDYLIAAVAFLGGGYLVFFGEGIPIAGVLVRGVGYLLMAASIVLASYSYGKSVGGADCYAQWKQADVAATVARQKQESNAASIAVTMAVKDAAKLTEQSKQDVLQIEQWAKAPVANPDCREPTRDDDSRLCQLTGNRAPGCADSK